MASERAVSANRQNARASTGPRTASGKQRASLNARSHGLSAAHLNAAADKEIARLADLIASEHASDPEVVEAAQTLAEAHVSLARIVAMKAQWLREEMETGQDRSSSDDLLSSHPSSALLQRLEQVERYERRAFSRRKSAARRFQMLVMAPQDPMTEPGER